MGEQVRQLPIVALRGRARHAPLRLQVRLLPLSLDHAGHGDRGHRCPRHCPRQHPGAEAHQRPADAPRRALPEIYTNLEAVPDALQHGGRLCGRDACDGLGHPHDIVAPRRVVAVRRGVHPPHQQAGERRGGRALRQRLPVGAQLDAALLPDASRRGLVGRMRHPDHRGGAVDLRALRGRAGDGAAGVHEPRARDHRGQGRRGPRGQQGGAEGAAREAAGRELRDVAQRDEAARHGCEREHQRAGAHGGLRAPPRQGDLRRNEHQQAGPKRLVQLDGP
mmetsp:Transcript_60213/g.168777  ORF Transcript_60213/g.168777 Transcript_60213/m.168777 type:complete len:278 (-) Transcript_60213:414-1247(-)